MNRLFYDLSTQLAQMQDKTAVMAS